MHYRMYINGKWTDAKSEKTMAVVNPATEETIQEVPCGGYDDAFAAIEAAAAAMPEWAAQTVYERGDALIRIAGRIRQYQGDLARTLTQEVGKPVAESAGEVGAAADQFEWYGEEIKRLAGDVIPSRAADKRIFTLYQPVGVAAAIAPWNFPLLLLSRKIAPALAAGCTAIGRPASQTPLATMEMFNLIAEVGLPDGVVNLVCGSAAEQSKAFFDHEAVRKISFTGSSEVGQSLIAKSAPQMKKLSLELGGHSPFIVCDDVTAEHAAAMAVGGKFRNMGQVCISPSRFFVPTSMLADFEKHAVAQVNALTLGNGLKPGSNVGPLANADAIARTAALVEDAVAKGARLLCGGKKPDGFEKGFFFEPTVLADVTAEMNILQEEPFCPILPIIPYDTLDQAIEMANDTPYGLAAYGLSNDINRAVKMWEGLDAGIIAINDTTPAAACCPFGGMKMSGTGREGWRQGLLEYMEIKYVSLTINDEKL
jgi:succinate-semialdehyde dehydrogenase/glutarate-semialdehyde dehydrogenase